MLFKYNILCRSTFFLIYYKIKTLAKIKFQRLFSKEIAFSQRLISRQTCLETLCSSGMAVKTTSRLRDCKRSSKTMLRIAEYDAGVN